MTHGGRDTPDRDERVRTVPTNGDDLNLTNGSGFDVPESPIVDSPPVKVSPPDTRALVRPQVIRDDTDDNPTVTACMDCLEYFPTARDSWERCPMCGSGLVDVDPAGDSV